MVLHKIFWAELEIYGGIKISRLCNIRLTSLSQQIGGILHIIFFDIFYFRPKKLMWSKVPTCCVTHYISWFLPNKSDLQEVPDVIKEIENCGSESYTIDPIYLDKSSSNVWREDLMDYIRIFRKDWVKFGVISVLRPLKKTYNWLEFNSALFSVHFTERKK